MVLVAAGMHHSAALDTEGGLWVWACEEDLSWARSLPQQVEGLPPLLNVACGETLIRKARAGPTSLLVATEEQVDVSFAPHTPSCDHLCVGMAIWGLLATMAVPWTGKEIVDY